MEIAAANLAALKLAQYDAEKRVPTTVRAIADAARYTEEMLVKEINRQWSGM
jgi:hypothetical protein